MGQAAGPLAAATSMASVGMSALGTVERAKGTQQADEYQAAELDRAAEYGKLRAVQTSGQLTQRLNQTLGNIDVIRAAAHTDPTSPTGAAVRDFAEDVGTNQRDIAVDSILAQSRQQESDAAYLRVAGKNALLYGKIGAAGQVLGGIGQGIKGVGGINFGGKSSGPTAIDNMPSDI